MSPTRCRSPVRSWCRRGYSDPRRHTPGVTGPLSIVPFIASDHARRVTCPVFIGLGERDSTCDHHDEARAYASSNDVTLFILERSAHCHNTAGARHVLWDRIARWIATLP